MVCRDMRSDSPSKGKESLAPYFFSSQSEVRPVFLGIVAGGLEEMAKQELLALSPTVEFIGQATGEIHFTCDWETFFPIIFGSRILNRLQLKLVEANCSSLPELESLTCELPWEEFIPRGRSLFIEASARKSAQFRNDMHLAQSVKDYICDRMRERAGFRPNIEKQDKSIRLMVRLRKERLWLGLDLGGGPLHIRGYRKEQGAAPLRETTAAALLWFCNWRWPQSNESTAFFDPTCGSGTLVIEAALSRLGGDPGLFRETSMEDFFPFFPKKAWSEFKEARRKNFHAKLEEERGKPNRFLGSDRDKNLIKVARRNAERAGLEQIVQFKDYEVSQLANNREFAEFINRTEGLVLCNPPYGERIGEKKEIRRLFEEFGELTNSVWKAWDFALLCGDKEDGFALGLRRPKSRRVYNGPLACELLYFAKDGERFADPQRATQKSAEYTALLNRTMKRLKFLRKWARMERIEAYRIYDCDMTEYRFRADLYGKHGVVVQEMRAPDTVDANRAARRRREFLMCMQEALELPEDKIRFRERQRQKGKDQYRKFGNQREYAHDTFTQEVISEFDMKFLINLDQYLDTGLFLDHRPLRKRLLKESLGKRVLNLFCYTGSLSVAAAHGGAKRIVSVDLSQKYCRWVGENFEENRLRGDYEVLNEDCLAYLKNTATEEFDIILFDPPTFSNSKKVETVFDVQRDHADYILLISKRLAKGGTLFFSTNARKFKFDHASMEDLGLVAKEKTKSSVPKDFRLEPPPHRMWEISWLE